MKYTRIKKYNDMIYDTRPVKFSDFMSNKYNIVHKKIYLSALNKYINEWLEVKDCIEKINKHNNNELNIDSEELEKMRRFVSFHKDDKKFVDGKYVFNVNNMKDFKTNTTIMEINQDEYWKPSSCVILTLFKNKKSPNLKWKVDLTPYWNTYQYKKDKDIYDIQMDKYEKMNDLEVKSFNYLTGKAIVYSDNIGREFEVGFDYLDGENINISDELLLSKNTFIAY